MEVIIQNAWFVRTYPWVEDEWYLAHKARWDALESQGWRFSEPQPLPNRVGLTIRRGDDHYTMYITKGWTPEEIHQQLLERCEYHANYPALAAVGRE